MILDAFTFWNELDVLELRLTVLDDVVDYFVLVEATETFSGQPKPLVFQEHRDRFRRWDDRILPVIVDDLPPIAGRDLWPREWHQRNAIARAVLQPWSTTIHAAIPRADDWLVISDVDEIPDPVLLRGVALEHYQWPRLYYGALNLRSDRVERGPAVVRVDRLRQLSPQRIREGKLALPDHRAGWHYSFLGGEAAARAKLGAFCHNEVAPDPFVTQLAAGVDPVTGRALQREDPPGEHPAALVAAWPQFAHLASPPA